jgi:hypothetical protein
MGIFSDDGVVGGAVLRRRETPRACRGADAAMEVLVLVARTTGTSSQGSELEASGTDFAGGGVGAGGVHEGCATGTSGVGEDGAARSSSWGVFIFLLFVGYAVVLLFVGCGPVGHVSNAGLGGSAVSLRRILIASLIETWMNELKRNNTHQVNCMSVSMRLLA